MPLGSWSTTVQHTVHRQYSPMLAPYGCMLPSEQYPQGVGTANEVGSTASLGSTGSLPASAGTVQVQRTSAVPTRTRCSGVLPWALAASTGAPAASRASALGVAEVRAARWRGVQPSGLVALTLAPCCSNSWRVRSGALQARGFGGKGGGLLGWRGGLGGGMG